MENYEILIEKAKKLHGGLCAGVVLGTRMSIAAMKEVGMDPMEHNENLVVYVEVDRCMTDGVKAVTGCSLGHRTLKFLDHGKFITTFIDTKTGRAIRVSSRDDKNNSYSGFWSWLEDVLKTDTDDKVSIEKKDMDDGVKKLSQMSDDELLKLEEVNIEIPENDLPGFPRHVVTCSKCGEHVVDGKEVLIDSKPFCRSCANI